MSWGVDLALIKPKIRTIVTDRGMEKFLKEMELIKGGSHVKVGIQANAPPPANADQSQSVFDMAFLASVHEFGSVRRRIPARPFIRNTMDEKRRVFEKTTNTLLGQIVAGRMTVRKALGILGLAIGKRIQRKITRGPHEALAQRTIDARRTRSGGIEGGERPLVDTGRMRASIRHKVVEQKRSINRNQFVRGEVKLT